MGFDAAVAETSPSARTVVNLSLGGTPEGINGEDSAAEHPPLDDHTQGMGEKPRMTGGSRLNYTQIDDI
jgi:hypothetical protein